MVQNKTRQILKPGMLELTFEPTYESVRLRVLPCDKCDHPGFELVFLRIIIIIKKSNFLIKIINIINKIEKGPKLFYMNIVLFSLQNIQNIQNITD